MRVLSIGTDRKIFEEGSAARIRQERYARELGNLDIIVFTRRSAHAAFSSTHLSATPTRSWTRLAYGFDAWRIARRLPKPDVVTAQDPFETGLIGLVIARLFRIPLHIQVHTDVTASSFREHSLLNRIRYHIAWFVLRRAACIRVILERTRDDLVAAGMIAPVTVLPIFVDTARFGSVIREKHPRWKIDALFIGRLESEKHPCLAIDAVAVARAAGHDIGLTVVGEGSERSALAERARRAGIADRVEFLGWRADTVPHLAKADVLLVPSRYEGYGLVIVEALAAGVPVIATDAGVAREAGAIIASEAAFGETLSRWAADGPRAASLRAYPYLSFDDYVARWCADIRHACGGASAGGASAEALVV